jgi:two-component SAPR family response regulator
LTAGDANGALDAAQSGLDVDSLNAGLWRLAMQAESKLGLRESLANRYKRLCKLLDDQFGLDPQEATRSLYYELLGQR